MERRQRPGRVHLEHRPVIVGAPALPRRAVEASVAGLDQAGPGARAVAAGKVVQRR